MDDEDEVVEFGRPRRPRRLRVGALALLGVVVLALLAGRLWARPDSTKDVSVPSPAPSAILPPASPTTKPWPSAPGACGSDVGLSIVSSRQPAEQTGVRVLLGGDRLSMVDFDAGRATTLSTLRSGEYAVVLRGGPAGTYGNTSTCGNRSRILRIGADRKISVIGSLAQTEAVLTTDKRAWVTSYPLDVEHSYGAVRPLDGGPAVRLPAGFFPYGAVGEALVGPQQPDPSTAPIDLLLVDPVTGHVLAKLGRDATLVAAGNGQVVWTSGCDPSGEGPCILHRRSVSSGATSSYPMPRRAAGGVVSPDGDLVAFRLERATADPRYDAGHPGAPSDIAIMHLDTGRPEIVPGVEIPAKTSPGLTFSADGRWLVIALDAGDRVRLLAWRSGLTLPFETTPIPGQVLGSPALAPAAAG